MENCRKLYEDLGLDALLIISPSNTLYLSGYRSSNCQILITKDKQYFITDMRYVNEATNVLFGRYEVINGNYSTIQELVKDCTTLGYDSDISFYQYKIVAEKFADKKLFEITEQINKIRQIKSEQEILNMKKAQEITELGLNEALKMLKEGVSEIEIAAMIEYVFLKNGAEIAFDSIVAFGENGASPHAHRTTRGLKSGDLITMDIGAKWNGYCADMTRTVGFGQLSDKAIDLYNTVLDCQLKCCAEIKKGMMGQDAHNIAVDFFKSKGVDEYFTHGLGHSVGIDIHEPIFLNPRSKDLIDNGMMITIEPGLYVPGKYGVRIEDTALIKNGVPEPLGKFTKNLVVL